MKTIPLSKGKCVIVDDGDYDYLDQWKWHMGNKGYAMRSQHIKNLKIDGKYKHKNILMHHLLIEIPKGKACDHINRDKLDNRRSNLRCVTRLQNQHNMKVFNTNTSGHAGVSWVKKEKKWRARIVVNYREIALGTFLDFTLAVSARKEAEKLYFYI